MKIRTMNDNDIDFAFGLTKSEGWAGETREVFKEFISYDHNGCFIGEYDSQKIGMCVAVKYNQNGFIGELIVKKEYRGNGFGKQLFFHSIDYLKSHQIKNIFLDGDLDAVPIYERSGFRKICESVRFVGKLPGKQHEMVRKVRLEDFSEIKKIDFELYGDDRKFFLEQRFIVYPEMCFVAEVDKKIIGYIMARPGNDVISVGPFATVDDEYCAAKLLETFALQVIGRILRIGILETNSNAIQLVRSFNVFEEQTPSWRMVLGNSERLGNHDGLYAIGSAATG